MLFKGIGRTFSTENDRQFETIGAFWDELAAKYGRENLQGLGYDWTERSIEYVIGLINGEIDGANRTVELPDTGWIAVMGKTADLGEIYERIYQEGRLKYEPLGGYQTVITPAKALHTYNCIRFVQT